MGRRDKLDAVWDPHAGADRVFEDGEILGPQIGKIVKIDSKGVYFTIDTYDAGKWRFGPAPYHGMGLAQVNTGDTVAGGTNHHHTVTLFAPALGNHCLAIFVGTGIGNPCVVSWWA